MEAMAVESLVASVWRLDGFLAVVRHALRTPRGYSDVDVVGVRADGAVRVGECKVRGAARLVNVETEGSGWSSWWDGTLANLSRLWDQKPAWLPAIAQVSSFEFHLVGNVWFVDEDARHDAEARLLAAVRSELPHGLKGKARAVVKPTVDLLFEATRRVREEVVDNGWGRRYGDPLLDALRELIRFAHAQPSGARKAGSAIRDEVRRELLLAIFGDPLLPANKTGTTD